MRFRFVTNLRPETVSTFEKSDYQPKAWLLSSHRSTRQLEEYAREFRKQKLDVYSDNGSKKLIDTIIELFKESTKELRQEIRTLRRSLPDKRRIPYPREVPSALGRSVSDTAHEVLDTVDRFIAAESVKAVLSKQLEIDPSHLIAKEDFGTVCLLALGLERDISGWGVSYFNRRNRISLNFWEQVRADPRCRNRKIFVTLSALDYATARAAARMAAKRGAEHVSIGFVGINKDVSFTRVFRIGHRRFLSGNAPRRYVRAAEIFLGVRDGYRDENKRLKSFHALGLGAIAQFPIFAACFDWYTELSADASSPMSDSVFDRVYYDGANWGDRVTIVEAAEQIAGGKDWPLQSPFLEQLKTDIGHNPAAARTWWNSVGQREIVRDDLLPSQPFSQACPVFASGKGGVTARQTRIRTGHNHWVVDHLADSVPSSKRAQWGSEKLDSLILTRKRTVQWGSMAAKEILTSI